MPTEIAAVRKLEYEIAKLKRQLAELRESYQTALAMLEEAGIIDPEDTD